jgi:hypothetical protein
MYHQEPDRVKKIIAEMKKLEVPVKKKKKNAK